MQFPLRLGRFRPIVTRKNLIRLLSPRLQPVECNSVVSDILITGWLSWGRIWPKLLQGLLKVQVETLEKLRIVWTPSCKQFLRSYLVALSLEHVVRRACLGDLVLDPSLLSLQQSTVLACQGRCMTDKQVGYFVQGLIVLVNCLNTTVRCCPSEFRMGLEAA